MPSPAGQDHEAFGELDQLAFSLAHRVDDDQFVASVPALLRFHQVLGDDAGHLSTGGLACLGGHAHESHGAATVDELYAVLGEKTSHRFGSIIESRIQALGGRAIDCD